MKAKKNIGGYALALVSGLAVVSVLFVLLGALFVLWFGYAPSRIVDEERHSYYSSERQQIQDLPPFTKIIAEVGEVSVRHGAEPAVFVENAWYLDRLYVDGEGTLLLRSRVQDRWSERKHIRNSVKNRWSEGKHRERDFVERAFRDRVEIILPVLTSIEADDDARVNVGPGFSGKKMDISLNGVASLTLEQADFDSMRLDLSGDTDFQGDAARIENLEFVAQNSASAVLINTAPQVRLKVHTIGTVDFELKSEGEGSIGEARVQAYEASDVTLRGFADGAPLLADVADTASLRYGGKPEMVQADVSGLASLKALD